MHSDIFIYSLVQLLCEFLELLNNATNPKLKSLSYGLITSVTISIEIHRVNK